MQIMTHALKEYDQILARASSEFCASMIQVWFMASYSDDESDASKVDQVKQWLPSLLPELLICSKLREADKRNIIQTKENDTFLERNTDKEEEDGEGEDDDAEDNEKEDYSVERGGSANTTLRKSAAYTLALFSKTF